MREMETKNVMIVGVGGQGSLLASKLLGNLLVEQGYDVKVSEVHGMSQRGGSVVTYVRYGDKVYSPVIDKGEADFIISFELLEAARWAEYLRPGGRIIVNTQRHILRISLPNCARWACRSTLSTLWRSPSRPEAPRPSTLF